MMLDFAIISYEAARHNNKRTMKEKKIKIDGKDVSMIYCAATENGFESLSGKSINVFVPEFGKDENGKTVVVAPAKAILGDFVTLAIAGIIAAYTWKGEEMPLTAEYILYSATPFERNDLITSIVELRQEWYAIPEVVEETIKKESESSEEVKNA